MMLHTNSKGLDLVVLDKRIWSCFPYISLCKTCDPREDVIFGTKDII